MIRKKTNVIWRFLFLGGSCLLLLAACRSALNPGDLFKDGHRSKPHEYFSHDHHDEALDAKNMACEECHLSAEGDITEEVSLQGRQSCHDCHADLQSGSGKKLKCLSCHAADMGAIMPSDHRTGWVSGHGSRVNLSQKKCTQCHSNRYCVQCHVRRGEADRTFHRGTALISHPLEARTNPAQCRNCHTADYCIRCHQHQRF